MGQKVNPRSFRSAALKSWDSRWFADKKRYKDLVIEDYILRKALLVRLKSAGIAKAEIARSITSIDVIVHVSRPGIVIGRGGSGLEELKKFIEGKLTKTQGKAQPKVELHVEPVKEPNLDAHLVATSIAEQLMRRIPHKRVANQMIDKVMSAGAKGIKVVLSGRIAGAEISRREKFMHGVVPLSTIREDIDFAALPALTKSGYIGVKVWICKK